MKNIFLVLLFLGYVGTLAASQDDAFIAVRKAFRVGNSARLAINIPHLQGHLLESYAIYYQLSLQLEDPDVDVDADTVRKFLFRYQGSLLADNESGFSPDLLGVVRFFQGCCKMVTVPTAVGLNDFISSRVLADIRHDVLFF